METGTAAPRASAFADDGRTRDRVSGLLLEHGPQTAAELAARLGISPAAVRRHLDSLVAAGRLEERQFELRVTRWLALLAAFGVFWAGAAALFVAVTPPTSFRARRRRSTERSSDC